MTSLGLPNATNARDLGGLRAADGRLVRRGVLFRADALSRLTEPEVELLGRLNLACVVDFRHPHEIEKVGPDRLPDPPPRQVVRLGVYNPEHDVFTMVNGVLRGEPGGKPLAQWLPDNGGVVAMMTQLYRWFVSSTLASDAFGRALRLIADPDGLPMLFHCTAGKDRTGWLSAVVLSVLGVDRATIVDDYLRTNEMNAPGIDAILAKLAPLMPDPTLVMPLLEARQEYIEEAFAEVGRCHGTMDAYVRDGLGAGPEVISALRASLLS